MIDDFNMMKVEKGREKKEQPDEIKQKLKTKKNK